MMMRRMIRLLKIKLLIMNRDVEQLVKRNISANLDTNCQYNTERQELRNSVSEVE